MYCFLSNQKKKNGGANSERVSDLCDRRQNNKTGKLMNPDAGFKRIP